MTVPSLEKLATDVPGLDPLTRGGIPRGRTTLIVGRSGTGKTVLGLQLACSLARRGSRVTYLASEEPTPDLLLTADALGLGASELAAAGSLELMDVRHSASGETRMTGEFEARSLVDRITSTSKTAPCVVVIDSLHALFAPFQESGVVRARVHELLQALQEAPCTVIALAEASSDYAKLASLGFEEYLSDLVLVLRNVVDGKRRRRTIEVHKYRRSGHYKGEYPFTIAADGVVVFPLDAVQRPERLVEGERFSSGIPELDAMTGGGWLRDSIVMVRGPSGSGKTTLAGTYARTGAERGERVCYYGFEEPRETLLRNFDRIGLSMAHALEKQALRVECRYPEATSPEDLLVDLRHDLDGWQPSLLVLDSISAIEHSTSQEGFRIFLIGLAAMLRERGLSALLVQTIPTQAEAVQEAPYLSTLVDAIVSLDYSADAPQLDRTLRVLKMRGSKHDSRQRTIRIDQGGVGIEGASTARPQ